MRNHKNIKPNWLHRNSQIYTIPSCMTETSDLPAGDNDPGQPDSQTFAWNGSRYAFIFKMKSPAGLAQQGQNSVSPAAE